VKYRAVDGKLVLKLTDDVTVRFLPDIHVYRLIADLLSFCFPAFPLFYFSTSPDRPTSI
jgi:hypothetical protein